MSTPPQEATSLGSLAVLDRLEVGPVEITTRGLKAPYRAWVGGESKETVLAYRYEEDVFDPSDPQALNLAAMVAAQVALNYGLLCREIVFRGPYDERDRRFIEEMAANTAREIYVNKFLKPNPLLAADVDVPFVRRESYLQAELVFPDSAPGSEAEAAAGRSTASTERWSVSRDRVAVLSSGGKESLLSYGLLKELGYETHSLFVNESGRHWYTALNGFRHLRTTDPERTVRIWTTADRVFNWMLRQLPVVRPDYHRIRADDYPVRLWTVAVFVFGALPVLRRRGIGRLVIGDEYDTTRSVKHRGIPHFDGLYDQSRFFDNALSLYYRSKGWGVSQFSLLRPMSELLVEKVLVERYPELQRHQVSCHSASVRGEQVYPCGRCEKCRRVVAMLTAVGGDPTRCGYDAEQISSCLAAAAEGGLHQESEGEQQLLWWLAEQGRLPVRGHSAGGDRAGKGPGQRAPGPHPEILALRFDERRSPIQSIPAILRRPLYAALLQHADGALRRSGRTWVPFDLINDPSLARPYRFEAGASENATSDRPGPPTAARDYLLAELTWPEAERRLSEVDIALLPVGAIEQHGPHLPLDTDAWDADHICREVARRCAAPRPLVLPPIPYGVSYHHQDFPGTISVGPDTLARLVYEVGMSAARNGISKLVIINGHGGNMPTLQYAAQMINRDAHIFTCVDTGETSDADVARIAETKADVHAGEIETSTTLATRPELVDLTRLEKFVPKFSSQYLDLSSEYSVEWYAHTSRLSPSGVLGDPTRASVEKGRAIWEVTIAHLTEFVEMLKPLSLAEIHERRS
ncbi:MAG: creatininase family protein [Candidatus Palauibacterales bacterium]|nr:creatininase family protein [Candidatus Palauibacterales bacterium]MDP2483187.1 creatininase family protein [Candidatus Palauibacterales bacterium]